MSATTSDAPPRWNTRLWLLLFVLSGNMLIDALEVSVAVVALPAIGAELGVGSAGLHWTMSGFALGFGGLLLAGGRIVAALGRRPVYLAALLGFAVTSLVGALAGDAVLLVVTRVVKGFCVALTAPTGLAIIGSTFAEGPARNRAVSVYSMFGACGFSVGLVLSGLLTEASWRWTFLFPAPVAVVLFAAAWWLIPRDEDGPAAGPSPLRAALLTRGPLVRSMIGAVALNGSYWGFLYVVTLHLQGSAGWSPLATGLAILPASLLLLLASPFSGRMVARVGAARLIALGAAAPPVGYLLYLMGAGPEPSYLIGVLPGMLLVGLGFALGFSALHVQAVTTAGAGEQGVVSGLYQTAVQLGGALVLAVTAALLAGAAPEGDPSSAQRPALLFVATVGALGLLAAVAGVLPRLRRGPDGSRSVGKVVVTSGHGSSSPDPAAHHHTLWQGERLR